MSVKERLITYINFKEIPVNRFEKICGLSTGYVRNMRVSIQPDKLSNIALNFADLNTGWLMTGEGQMLKSDSDKNKNSIVNTVPLLTIAAQGGSFNDFVVSVKDNECERIISPIKGAEFAMPVAGDSMSPEYPSGSQVLIKKINEKAFIDWGKVYVLDTCNGTVIKILSPSEERGYVKCTSINPDPKYAPFEISLEDVYGVYRVLLCMSIK